MKLNNKIPFLITIDTEGDNLWSKPSKITTTNAKQLYRFQELCNKYDFKPTYLTNYEMAMDEGFVDFGKKFSLNNQCEIGMHLHAWNSPTIVSITDNDYYRQPYLIDYNPEVMEEKIVFMTTLLQEKFEQQITSHRAGRWAMNETYMNLLEKYKYTVDCSVTPGVCWTKAIGGRESIGGSDYGFYPKRAYHPSYENMAVAGDMKILEVPVTIIKKPRYNLKTLSFIGNTFIGKNSLVNKLCYQNHWLRPTKDNLNDMIDIVDICNHSHYEYLEFMIHSSEFTEGLNPTFLTEDSIDKLFCDIEKLFEIISMTAYGCTLKEFSKLGLLNHLEIQAYEECEHW